MSIESIKRWNTVAFILGVGVVFGYFLGFVMGVALI